MTDQKTNVVPPSAAPGETLAGRFALQKLVAQGGMGWVFEATRVSTHERVAVKVLREEWTLDDEVRRRFRRESAVLNSLDHPSIVRVQEDGTDERGRVFMVMEWLEGMSLRARLQSAGPVAADELGMILMETAQALGAAHDHGVIHGDVKPENVFLREAPVRGARVTLMDFGISKVLGLDRLTRTGEVVGTPAYMAPETITGQGPLDGTADTYALGILAYECLSGRLPFAERNPGRLLVQVVSGETVPLVTEGVTLPEGVVASIARAMAREPADRFESPVAFAKAFADAL